MHLTTVPKARSPNHQTVILVFGSPALSDMTPKPRLLSTLTTALHTIKANPQATVILTGGAVQHTFSEAEAMKRWLDQQPLRTEELDLHLETKSLNTLQNVQNVLPMVLDLRPSRIILITVKYHMQRAFVLTQTAFSAHGLQSDYITLAAENDISDPQSLEAIRSEETSALQRDVALLHQWLESNPKQ